MSDWAQEGDEADKFLEYSQQELDDLNKEGAAKPELETSAILSQAQSTPVQPKQIPVFPGSSIPKFGFTNKNLKRKDVTPPKDPLDQKKVKPPKSPPAHN